MEHEDAQEKRGACPRTHGGGERPRRPIAVAPDTSWLGRCACGVVAALLLIFAPIAPAAESDVHFGLTRFLAIQAGFDPAQAEQIATGNQRVASGDMQFMALLFDYACLGRDAELAAEVSARHYPSNRRVPAPPEQRAVAAGSELAWKGVREMDTTKSSQANFLLQKFGQALHALQASYSHQGVPDAPLFDGLFACDPALSWAHPRSRGGAHAHGTDLTKRWPAETVLLAKATYDALLRFPSVGATVRKPRAWEQVRALLDGFIKAATKADKRAWFEAQGFTDVSFLGGTSLKDGGVPFELEWVGRRLPKLPALQSRQHETDPAVLDFFNRFFTAWLSTDDFERVAAEHGLAAGAKAGKVNVPFDRTELAARLRLWRVRDHGAVADLAHAQERLTARQLTAVAALARAPGALARYANPADAVFPLITNTEVASPLLPFIVRKAPASAGGNERAVAITKLRHLPYDTLGVVGERVGGEWKVIALVGVVDH